jgi:hypothetical protein
VRELESSEDSNIERLEASLDKIRVGVSHVIPKLGVIVDSPDDFGGEVLADEYCLDPASLILIGGTNSDVELRFEYRRAGGETCDIRKFLDVQ